MHFKLLEKEEQTKPKTCRAKTMRSRPKKSIQKINETKSWFFGNINEINKTP
jgi:hypothetical protein